MSFVLPNRFCPTPRPCRGSRRLRVWRPRAQPAARGPGKKRWKSRLRAETFRPTLASLPRLTALPRLAPARPTGRRRSWGKMMEFKISRRDASSDGNRKVRFPCPLVFVQSPPGARAPSRPPEALGKKDGNQDFAPRRCVQPSRRGRGSRRFRVWRPRAQSAAGGPGKK